MIRCGFLSEEDRKALIALARHGLAAGRVTRRATALVRLDEGLSCQEVAKVLLFDDDTIRSWYELFEQGPRLRKPLGADRVAASPRTRISQARSHLPQARSENAGGVHRELRKPDEFHGRRRGRGVRGRRASNPCCAGSGLL